MLKKRIISVLPVYNDIVVQSIGFTKYLPIGNPNIAIEFLNKWGIDEIIVLQINAREINKPFNASKINEMASKCFVPLTYGGGIQTVSDVHTIIHNGADKISLNQPVLHNPGLIQEVAVNYGNQCIVASVDVISAEDKWLVYDYLQKKTIDVSLDTLLKRTVDKGAGEILINSVNRDGSYSGYDIPLMQHVCNLVSVPILACGGAKHPGHMYQLLLETNVSGAVAGNFFHFYEHSVTITKKYLSERFNFIRSETYYNYEENKLDANFRLEKKSDLELQHLLYTRIEKEVL